MQTIQIADSLVPLQHNTSLETQLFLAFKHRTPNRYRLLDKLVRANITPEDELTDKTRLLHPKARSIAAKILSKLARNGIEETILTYKQLKALTRCLPSQNRNIIQQLGDLFEFEYKRKYLKYEWCYVFQIHPNIKEIIKGSDKKGGTL